MAYRFTSKELDPDFVDFNSVNRRYHFPYRNYAPFRAAFLQLDPLLTLMSVPLTGRPEATRSGRTRHPRNPLQYASGNPGRKLDPSGLQETPGSETARASRERQEFEKKCCDDAKGLAGGASGGVICCKGVWVICVWGFEGTDAEPTAREIYIKCTREHEGTHLDDVECTAKRCEAIHRPPYKSGRIVDEEECRAYTEEFSCLEFGKLECDKAADRALCELLIDVQQKSVQRRGERYCKNAHMPPPGPGVFPQSPRGHAKFD